MKFRKAVAVCALVSFSATNLSFAQWTNTKTSVWDYKFGGSTIARFLDIQHVAQPTNYSCGAASISSATLWLTSQQNNPILYDVASVYSFINTNGADGIVLPELTEGIKSVIAYTNTAYKLNIKVNPTENAHTDAGNAIVSLLNHLKGTERPAFLLGNTKRASSYFGAGTHYYLVKGAAYCATSQCNLSGLWLNDPVYDSSAFPDRQAEAIQPYQFVSENELTSTYWLKTGSAYPWERKYQHITF